MTLFASLLCIPAVEAAGPTSGPSAGEFVLDYGSAVNAGLQGQVEKIDRELREKLGMTGEQAAVGVLDRKTGRLALIHPDRIEYAASVPKVGILLTYFHDHPEATTKIDPAVQHELGLMAKASSNEMASKYSHQLGLKHVQEVLGEYKFYDAAHGGGIWVGKHYGKDSERYPDPVGNHSHAATVRQLVRFWLLLDQGKLVSPEACAKMKEIFASPDVPHDDIKFVKGLKGRDVQILRKWGSWENWLHDTALVEGKDRKYILVALTQHPKGDEYLEELARRVDDLMQGK